MATALPALEWRVSLQDTATLERGVARFNAQGEIVGTTPPEILRRLFDGREPEVWADALKTIEEQFGRGGCFAEVSLAKEHIRIDAQDPQNRTRLQTFILTADGIKRFGNMVSPFALTKPRFYLEDLEKVTPERLQALKDATAKRLGLPAETVSAIAIGKGSLDPSPDGNVTVEIRAEEAPFERGGRVNWEIDGREIKAYLP